MTQRFRRRPKFYYNEPIKLFVREDLEVGAGNREPFKVRTDDDLISINRAHGYDVSEWERNREKMLEEELQRWIDEDVEEALAKQPTQKHYPFMYTIKGNFRPLETEIVSGFDETEIVSGFDDNAVMGRFFSGSYYTNQKKKKPPLPKPTKLGRI